MPSGAHTWPGHFWALGLSGSRGCLGDSDAHSPGPRASLHAGQLGGCLRVGIGMRAPVGSESGGGSRGMLTVSSLCSFGVKLTDFQAYRRGGAVNRKHMSPASQPPLPPADGGTSAPAGPEPPPQSPRAESSPGGGAVLSSAGTLEQGPSLGDSR